MQDTVYGTFRNGSIELDETPAGVREARVQVRFLRSAVAVSSAAQKRALDAIEAIRQLVLTDEEERILDGFDAFQKAHPFSLRQLVED